MIGLVNGLLTAVLIVLFIGIWVWAWSGYNKKNFDEMARLPLEDTSNVPEARDVD